MLPKICCWGLFGFKTGSFSIAQAHLELAPWTAASQWQQAFSVCLPRTEVSTREPPGPAATKVLMLTIWLSRIWSCWNIRLHYKDVSLPRVPSD